MQSTVLLYFAVLVVCTCAQVYRLPGVEDNEWFKDLYFRRPLGGGYVFGRLGSTDNGLIGNAGYTGKIFDDHRGVLQGQAYGTRVLGADGDSSILGTKIDWHNANDNARATLDVHKEVGQGSGMTLSADGVWKVDKDTRLVAGGNVEKTFGHDKPQVGVQVKVEHDF